MFRCNICLVNGFGEYDSMKTSAPFVLFLLLCAAASTAEHKQPRLPFPSELKPGTNSSVWLSKSRLFAFGFYETPAGYAVCIFLAGFFGKTVVWTANKIDPILPNNVISLSLDRDGLRLWQKREQGDLVYQNIAYSDQYIAGASMLDSGNFVLYNRHSLVIWQSFDHPTGALLSGQSLPSGGELFSTVSETDLALGKFRVKMQDEGLIQYPIDTPDTTENAYCICDTSGVGSNVSLHLYDGGLSFYNSNGDKKDMWRGRKPKKGSIYLARIDPDGIFRLYTRSLDRESNWMSIWWSTEDKCAPKGVCGINSYCSDEDGIVNCTCVPGFGNGCKEEFGYKDCRKKIPSVRYEMRRMENVTWQDNYYAINNTITEQECGRACLDDCDCVVAMFKNGHCRKQRFPLKYGRTSRTASSVVLVRLTLPVPASALPPPDDDPGKPQASGTSICIVVLFISSIIITGQRRLHGEDDESKQNVNKLLLNHGSLAPKRYSYKEIKKITNSFAEKLGQGGYGIVYKGKLPDDQLVAVKLLKETHDNVEEFVNEVASISRTSHVNIVNLLGFCFERKKRALVYEFMPNKSLDKFIYKSGSVHAECSFEWKKLYEIAVGVAKGLEYLHRGCNTRIIHFDIKPQNILLDEDLCPKISDFGLAKLCVRKQSVVSMLGTRGTIGYIAPEVFSRNFGVVSHKSDVYSFGIMLLQMAEARINVENNKSFLSSEDYFLEKIYEQVLVQNEKVYAEIRVEEEEVVRKMLMVGFWCIQTAPSDRPSMNNVVEMFAGNMQSIQMPPLPFLLSSPKPEFSCLLAVTEETQCFSRG